MSKIDWNKPIALYMDEEYEKIGKSTYHVVEKVCEYNSVNCKVYAVKLKNPIDGYTTVKEFFADGTRRDGCDGIIRNYTPEATVWLHLHSSNGVFYTQSMPVAFSEKEFDASKLKAATKSYFGTVMIKINKDAKTCTAELI